ncbi:MAG TPA: SpoIIE family protein phosphatase [Bacteroidota bacterium]
MRIRLLLYILVPSVLFFLVFIADAVRKNVDFDLPAFQVIRELVILVSFFLLFLYFRSGTIKSEYDPVRALRTIFLYLIAIVSFYGLVSFLPQGGFESKDLFLVPLDYTTIFSASLLGIGTGMFALSLLISLREFVFLKRRRATKRSFVLLLVALLGTVALSVNTAPLETSTLGSILFGLAISLMLLNSFRQTWIVYLSRKDKIAVITYSFFALLAFGYFDVQVSQITLLNKSLLYYSSALREFVLLMGIFAMMYIGMAFVTTIFHLPTAEAFDRKMTEFASLQNLSRLVKQVFDFNELVETVTKMTLEVCEAKSSWLELLERPKASVGKAAGVLELWKVEVAALQNISAERIAELNPKDGQPLRDLVLGQQKVLVIDDVKKDRRLKHLRDLKLPIRSLLVVPLVSHAEVIGYLYVTKDVADGFDKDDVNVVSAFADQATIAIENSRLIKDSIERERLYQEMMVAQQMQKKLLPQELPSIDGVEIIAISSPAFEVGGDYYDFVRLDHRRLGIVVGDVSGKGVSAAFTMAQMKGIFQSLSKICTSPKEFLIKANHALRESIDRKTFVSVVYSILDTETGEITLSRAGHCPVLYLTDDSVRYLKPVGLGLGMTDGSLLEEVTEEERFHLKTNDVCVFYTDGITEARNPEGEEFGYERLLQVARDARAEPAESIKQHVLDEVYRFLGNDVVEDDVTLVILKWLK